MFSDREADPKKYQLHLKLEAVVHHSVGMVDGNASLTLVDIVKVGNDWNRVVYHS